MQLPESGIEMLAKQPLFAGLSHKELKSIVALGVTMAFPSGKKLTAEDAIGLEAFLVVSGDASCLVGGGVEVAKLGPGDFFGELSLLDGARRSATVVATSDMVITVFDKREFRQLIENSPSVALKLLETMAARLRAADRKLATANSETE
jgi:CRP-like cAMP-binding protein